MTLQGDWVTEDQRRAGKVLAAFLAEQITPEAAGRQGFRPADPDIAPAGLVTRANGVDPRQPARVLRLPEPKVLAKLKQTWRADRKPANVMMVFDASGSMGEENKLEQAAKGLKGFFRQAAPQDRIGLIKFSNAITPLVGIEPMTTNRAKLLAATDTILPDDDTRVRDATLAGVDAVAARLDRDAINAVVLLTDGEDTSSSHSASEVIAALEQQREKETGQIRVFTIAYGSDSNQDELAEYAKASGGQSYKGGADDIGSIYRSISSFF
jgi:Ca-activated chloride channel family protein